MEKLINDFSFGLDYLITDRFSIGVSFERGDYASFKFVYKNNPVKTYEKSEYTRGEVRRGDNKYTQLINNLEENGIGVKKLTESAGSIGLQLTQVIHPNLQVVEQIIAQSARDAGITEEIKKDMKLEKIGEENFLGTAAVDCQGKAGDKEQMICDLNSTCEKLIAADIVNKC